ncbi:MAG: type II secretion system protein [Candidatus Komeilibacteria bacterium]
MNKKYQKGFTLIELLVVIAIIGLLSTLAVVSLNNAREKARDATRMADIKLLNNAIQLYIQANDAAPVGDTANDDICLSTETCWSTGDFGTALRTYSANLATDPTQTDTATYHYVYISPDAMSGCSGGCATCNQESYQLYAAALEGTGAESGFNESECGEWIAPE